MIIRVFRMRCATLAFRCAKHQLGLPLTRFASTSSSVVTKLAYDKYMDEYDYGPELSVPLVMVHGLFGHKENWRSLAKALQQRLGNTVFALDLRNHGECVIFSAPFPGFFSILWMHRFLYYYWLALKPLWQSLTNTLRSSEGNEICWTVNTFVFIF